MAQLLMTEQQVRQEDGQDDEEQFGPMLISRLEVSVKKLDFYRATCSVDFTI